MELVSKLAGLDSAGPNYAAEFVEHLLLAARSVGVSDVHLQPTGNALDIRWRLDGVLQPVGEFPCGEAADIVARLKVLANLLTYRTDVPQEGRFLEKPLDSENRLELRTDLASGARGHVEMRLSTFPTLYGERAVVRLFAAERDRQFLEELDLPAQIHQQFRRLLGESSGAVIVSGPAGSGKTTTAYAMLREVVRRSEGGRSVVSLEDPIETAVSGVAQSQVREAAGFNLATGLRSLMRQDPEVLMVGEIRDPETARIAFQASLTGHLVITTFHAGSAAAAVSRLSDMGIEPYLLRSGVLAIISQRLLRRLCECARNSDPQGALPNNDTTRRGCPRCRGTGYHGRFVLAELMLAQPTDIGRAILSKADAPQLERLAIGQGMVSLRQQASQAMESGHTDPDEVRRVFGWE